MCAVVTVGAVVGPTCGACAARARRWPTAYRRVPKRCAPKSWGLFSTKIINRAIFACFAPRKQVRVCKFHSFGGVFCFLLYTRAQKRASPPPRSGNGTARGRTGTKNGQTADEHTGCLSAVWPLLDRSRRAVPAFCRARQRHRATTRSGAQAFRPLWAMSHSAICTALSAAPFLIWSLTSQKVMPLGLARSLRMRPT